MTPGRFRIAAFRPDDGRAARASSLLESLGAEPVIDPMVELQPTGNLPRTDVSTIVLTSPAAATILADAGWDPGEAAICAIGDGTASALREAGYEVSLVPEEYSSSGMVTALADRVDGDRVEVARSDHGSAVLLEGLVDAGAVLTETIIYELEMPADAGFSTERAADGDLHGMLFTSALTVEHFMDAAAQRDVADDVSDHLDEIVVGVIGGPTRDRAEAAGIAVDIVPETADFELLARNVMDTLSRTNRPNPEG